MMYSRVLVHKSEQILPLQDKTLSAGSASKEDNIAYLVRLWQHPKDILSFAYCLLYPLEAK